ncbi:sugar ABC transporter ATP-binding protein [Clostridium sp. AM58-1XD]|uniref:sugar ABC transporter ATP-binding protein n=1 Tax=Clostridium sp. AM58-1XD TaxID=2292307 RepID=UPI000E4CD0AA|nr:sugar ABC transporter ATP-binding protein [Clostridium sp. AM58-1XD]RGZ00363.1 sugar ABC transporter ATP-binding protein [Clostridium sp. AM58-1XD]
MAEPILQTCGIIKGFFGVQVLKGIDFEVCPGETMGLVGENGAGKSTLMKIITGLYTNDGGTILYEGKQVEFSDPSKARDMGISIIHQEFNLFSQLSVAENIFLDRKKYRNRCGVINWKKMYRDAESVLKELGADLDVHMPVKLLSVREQQLVEIAKAVSSNAKVLIMDEPSAALPDNEVQKMFDVVNMLKKRGTAIVYISHRMKEIEQICDRVSVLRDGRNVGVVEMAEGKVDEVISMMIGREIKDYYPHTSRDFGEVVLRAERFSGDGLKNVSLNVRSKEVVGLYGLAGSGSTEFAEMLMGIRKRNEGAVFYKEKEIRKDSIRAAMDVGIGYVPPDRRQEGVVVMMDIAKNTVMANLTSYEKNAILQNRRIYETVQKHIDNLRIKCVGQDQEVQRLSGGNQQKVVLAKWLDRSPGLLILNEPTRGVDVGAKSEIYKMIDKLANEGLAILMISSEVPEILGVSDRVVVMCRGKISGEYENKDLGQDILLKAASGGISGGRDDA